MSCARLLTRVFDINVERCERRGQLKIRPGGDRAGAREFPSPPIHGGTRMRADGSPEYAATAAERTLSRRTVDQGDVAAQLIKQCRSDSITGQTILSDCGRV